MNQMNTPEVTLAKAQEFLKTHEEDNTLVIINDFILNSKKKYWTQNHEQIILILVDLCIKKNRLKLLRDGLNYYRGLSQNSNIDSLANVLNKTKELVEEKFLKAVRTYQDIKLEIQDLDSEDSPDLFFLYSFDDNVDSKEKEDLINSQKFIWDTYKVLLDLTKTNSKLLSLYSQILKSAFVFCKENKRKVEFKRLCDSVRGYLQTLIKTEKKQFFQNKVQISRPEVLKILIQIRISLLDTATELEQWQEAFKTAEDIIFLMDKYEKSQEDSKDGKTKKSTKIPPLMKLEFYSNVEKLLWISDYPLYHAHSTILIKELASKAQKWAKALKTPEKIKEAQSKLEIFDIDNINNRIVLASLVTPFKNSYTNYVSIGSELFENGREIDTQTCSRMMSILKMNTVPGRANLINFIETHNLVSECEENIRNLYFLLQKETNPFSIARRGKEILNYLQSKAVYSKYVQLVSNNLTVRCMTLLAKNYDNISFQRLSKIITWVERENLEEILIENTRKGILTCTLDHASNIIKFKNSQGVFNDLSEKINNFYSTISKITSLIILNEEENNREKLAKIREVIYKEIHSHNTDSLVIYDALLNKMEQTNSKLASYLKDKENYKETLRESQLKEREEQKRKADEEAKMMKELLKDEQKKKEFDIQLKKYLIERIKIYTNVLFIDGKKVKLDEILKDLSKFSDEQLIKLLEKEEYEFKTKKEKKFKQIAKETDYVIREFRKRDYESTIKSLMEEEKVYNQSLEEESKKSYNEKIGFKSNIIRFADFKTAFFSNIQIEREIEYNDKMKTFSESLYKKVHEDLLKDMGPGFKSYVDEFRKREEESQLKQQNTGFRPTGGFMKKGEKFIREEKPKTSISVGMTDFKKGVNYVATTNEPKPMENKTSEFKKGSNLISIESTSNKIEISKGSNVPATNTEKKPEFKRAEATPVTTEKKPEFKRAEQTPVTTEKKPEFKRAEAIPVTTEKKPEFKRAETTTQTKGEISKGSNVEKEKENKPKDTISTPIKKAETSKPSTDASFQRGSKLPQKEEPKKDGGNWRK